MGTKYSSITVAGYNASPPPDDGSQTAANQVKYSTTKTKLSDPLNTAIASINSALVTFSDFGSRQVTTNDTPTAADHMKTVEIAPSVTTSVTVSLPDCTTVAAGFIISVKNSSAIAQTIGRATSGNTIDGAAANVTIAAGAAHIFKVNTGATGYLTLGTFNAPFVDSNPIVAGSSDASKRARMEVDGLTTATTRVLYVADEDSAVAQSWDVKNIKASIALGSNALTLTVDTPGGASASNPMIFKYRNATSGTGDYVVRTQTAALTVTASSGSTLGTVSGAAHRIYFGVADDAGTQRLFLYNPYNATGPTLLGLNSSIPYSSTSEGGAGAADSAQVLYSGTSFSSKSIIVLGYFESTQATAGTWATTPSKIHLFRQGDYKTGDIVQSLRNTLSTVSTGTTTTPSDDTIPQNTEGDEYLTQAITPTSSINLLEIEAQTFCASSNAGNTFKTLALHQDSTANALNAGGQTSGQNQIASVFLKHRMQANTTSSTTMRLRAGASAAGTLTVNGAAGARVMGGVLYTYLDIVERFV